MGSTEEGSAAEMDDDGTPSGTTLPFDAVANLRLLAEVQRRGVDAANLVIARLTERTNTAGGRAARPNPADQMATLTDAFIDSVTAVAGAMMPTVGPPGSAEGARAGEPTGAEVLTAEGEAGQLVEVDLWIHNYTDDLATGVELHASDLVHASGERLAQTCVTARPSAPFDLSAKSSRSVTLCVDVPEGAASGCYRGIVTAAHLADLWVVVQVEVRAARAETSATGAPPPDPAP